MTANSDSIIIEVNKSVFPEKNEPFSVNIQLRINDEPFINRLLSLDSKLYYSEKNIISSLFSRKTYNFVFADVVSINRTPGASFKRVFSYRQLLEGITVDFKEHNEADAFKIEIYHILTDHLQKEHQVFKELTRISNSK